MRSQWLQKTSAVVLSLVMAATLIPSIPKAQRVSAAEGDVEVNATNFPNENFRNWIKTDIPGGSDGTLTASEISKVTQIVLWKTNTQGKPVDSPDITDFTGVEKFTNLQLFYITGQAIESKNLDVSKLSKLTSLYCDSCELDSLITGDNTSLGYINGMNNNLTLLDLSGNPNLERLLLTNNKLKSLDVSKNTNLAGLDCDRNQLETLNLGTNKKFKLLCCNRNNLTSLDLSGVNLRELWCQYNQLTDLDLSKQTNLETLLSFDNWKLHTLDVSNCPLLNQFQPGYSGLVSVMVHKDAPLGTLADLEGNEVKVLATPSLADGVYGTYEYDLTNIDPNIDGNKISILAADTDKGMSLSGTKLKGLKLGETVTYDYRFAEGKAIQVTIIPSTDSIAWNRFTTPLSIDGWEVGQTPNKPVAVADKGEVTFTYSDKKDGTYGDLPANPHAGTWYVKASVEKTDEYIGLSEIKSFEIKEKATTQTTTTATTKPTTPTKVSITKAIAAKVKATTYTGYKKKPSVTVTYNGKKLKKGTDYTVSYKNNTKVGTAKVIIKGKGNYTGTKTVTFKIKKRTKVAKGIYVVKHDVYGRKGPAKAKKITMVFRKGDKVTVTKLSKKVGKNRWVKVTKNGKSAYVFSKYLK